jgi:hypothetical protein
MLEYVAINYKVYACINDHSGSCRQLTWVRLPGRMALVPLVHIG